MEIWKDVKGYEGIYQVSNTGLVRSIDRVNSRGAKIKGRVLAQAEGKGGYKVVCLSKEGKAKEGKVHRLVAQAFIENLGDLPQVNHIDGDKENNEVENLEWVTAKRNIEHAHETGLRDYRGKRNPKYDNQVRRWINKVTEEIEECTQYELRVKYGLSSGHMSELINGSILCHKGWMLEEVYNCPEKRKRARVRMG